MHCSIKRAMKRTGDIFTPSQLAMVMKLVRKNPYKVTELEPNMITDWKGYSQQLQILRIRSSDEGLPVDWTKMMLFFEAVNQWDKLLAFILPMVLKGEKKDRPDS